MLKVRGLHTYYGDLHALRGVSLHVRQGEIVSVIGNNGAGKTTTLMTVSGVLRPRRGEIEFDGKRIEALKPAEIVELGVGHVPEGRQLFASMTVEENLLMGACTRRAKGPRAGTLDRVYALFPRLLERRRQLAGTLSGGEQQMVAIGRGLMTLPRLLMLDEPSLGLSPVMVTAMFEAIRQINQSGTTILLVEQNVFRALRLSHRGYVLEDGGIVAEGSSSDLVRNPQVRTTYLGL
jgi:branched-chain amino acid transport system ATP-binding protein